MKVGIITFHAVWNCGAVLQCYALKTKVESLGHLVQVIDYNPDYIYQKYRRFQNPFLIALIRYRENFGIKAFSTAGRSFIRTLKYYNPKLGRNLKREKFIKFRKANFVETVEIRSIEELKKTEFDFDVVISGSDQVWNPTITKNQIDPAFYCDFGNEKLRRVGYAISACQLDVQKYKGILYRLVNKFDYLSLREQEKIADIQTIYEKKVYQCIDPTLLLDASSYSNIEKNISNDKEYILVYGFDNASRDVFQKVTKKISEMYKIPVLVLGGIQRWAFDVVRYEPFNGVDPGEFLSYIKNAKVIVTNSFHAIAFSVIYQKEFYAVSANERASRITELLDSLCLSDRLILDSEEVEDLYIRQVPIDYEKVYIKLVDLRKQSEKFLEIALKS